MTGPYSLNSKLCTPPAPETEGIDLCLILTERAGVTPTDTQDKRLRIDLTLRVPRGQDLLVGDGQGLGAEIEPQRVVAAGGEHYWQLPGASLRGAFAHWFKRLVSRDQGGRVADSYNQYLKDAENGRKRDGNWIGRLCLDDAEIDKLPLDNPHEQSPVAHLFGSLLKAGRMHISDGFQSVSDSSKSMLQLAADDSSELQKRMHVAVNALTGGAIEHMLFDNFVLTRGEFPVTILIDNPTEHEVEWLAQTLQALHAGVIRIGSSKSAGRLELKETPQAEGSLAEEFLFFMPEEPQHEPESVLAQVREGFAKHEQLVGGSEASEEAKPDHIAGTIAVTKAKSGKVIVKLTYQRPDKKTPTTVDCTTVSTQGRGFRVEDAEDGDPIHVFLTDDNKVQRVIIPGKTEVKPRAARQQGSRDKHRGSPVSGAAVPKGSPELLGLAFHNPYTFLPFSTTPAEREPFTPRTVDECLAQIPDRFTGNIRIRVKLASPLLTSQGMHEDEKRMILGTDVRQDGDDNARHKTYQALTIGDDVIVPTTGVRGFVRYLMTVITGSPVPVLDPHMYLCQGRDAQLGPVPGDKKIPSRCFLAEIVRPPHQQQEEV